MKSFQLSRLTCSIVLLYSDLQEYPEYEAYTTPVFFCDDWLNIYLDNYHMHNDPNIYSENNEISCSDYRFVYMGAKGSSIFVIDAFSFLLIIDVI